MAGNSRDLRILIRSELERTSKQTIINQLEDIKKKYGNLQIHINIDQQALTALTNISNSINKITQTTQSQAQATTNATNAVIKETQAVKDLTAEQIKLNVEKQKTITAADKSYTKTSTTSGNKFDNITNTETIFAAGGTGVHASVRNTDTAGLARKNAADALAIEAKYAADFAKLLKDEEIVDKAHYQALKTVNDQALAYDKNHVAALKMNKEKYVKDLTRLLNEEEAQEKQHYLALQKNSQLDLASQKKAANDTAQLLSTQNKSEREVLNLQRRYGTGDSSVDNTQLTSLLGQLKGLTTASADYKTESTRLSNEISKIGASAKSSTGSVINFGDALKSAIIRLPTFMLAGLALREVFSFFSSGIKYVNEFNATLTQISTAVNYNQAKVEALGKTYQALAVQMGATSKEVASGALEFYRQGLGDEEVLKRLKLTTEYAKISGLDFTRSADLLTAASSSMKVDITKVADVFTLLGDKTSTSASEIATAMQKVGSSAESIGVPFEKVSAIIATLSSVTREAPETVGTAVKSILSRIESVKKKGYDSEDGTTINQVSTALHAANIELVGANGQFRDFSTVLDELAKKWGSLDDKTQRYVATTVASTTQQSRFLAIMSNYGQVLDLTNQALNAAGTTQAKYNLYLEGTQSHIDRLKARMETLWGNSFNSEGLKSDIDMLGSLVSGVDSVIKTFGLVPTIIGFGTIALLTFNTSLRSTISTFAGGSLLQGLAQAGLKIQALSMFTNAYTGSAVAAKFATIGLQVALTAGIGFAIVGISMAITSLIQNHQKLAEEQHKFEAQQKTIAESYGTQKDNIDALVKEYDDLTEKKAKFGLSVDDDKRYLDISTQLSTLLPNLIQSIDAKGVAHLKSADAIKEELIYAQKLATLEDERKLTSAEDNFGTSIDKRKDLEDQLKTAKKQQSTGTVGGGFLDFGVKDISENEDALKALEMRIVGLDYQIKSMTSGNKDEILALATNFSKIKIPENVNIELKKIIDSLDTNSFDKTELAAKSTAFGQLIIKLSDIKKLQDSGDRHGSYDSSSYQSYLKEAEAIGLTIVQAKSLSDSILRASVAQVEAKQSAEDYAKSIDTLDTHITSTDKSIKSLASAYEKLQSGEQLSTEETLKLVEASPQLLDYLLQHNGLITDKGAFLQKVAQIEQQTRLSEAQGLLDGVTDTYNALEAKRKMYEQFYKLMQPLADFNTGGFGKENDQFGFLNPKATQVLSAEETAAKNAAEQSKKLLTLRVQLLSQPIDLATYGKNKPKAGKVAKDNTQSEVKRNFSAFESAIKNQDILIVKSEDRLSSLTNTSAKYRAELASQIPYLKEKQRLSKIEISDLEKANAEIQKKLKNPKLTESQQNTLKNDSEANSNKKADLLHNIAEFGKTASEIANKNSLSLVNEAIDKTTKSTDVLDQKIKNLKTSMSSIKTDPARKIADQGVLLETYGKAQDEIIKSVATLTDQSKTLDKNSDAWAKVQDQINKYKDTYNQIDSESTALRDSVANQIIDSMKKGIQAEIDAEKALHDQKIKNIDDATNTAINAIDKIQAANDYNKNLEKDQTSAQDIQNQINAYSLDDSNEGKSKVIELKKQLADQKEKIDDEQTKHSNEIIKQSLQDQNKSLKDNVDDASKIKTDGLTNQLNDDTHWLKLETDLVNGNVTEIQSTMKTLLDGLGQYATDSLAAVTGQVTKVQAEISKLTGVNTQVGQLASNNNNNTAGTSTNSSDTSTGVALTWQEKLAKAAADDTYALSELNRAKEVYTTDKANGDTDGADAAHKYADQLRGVNSSLPKYITGGLNTKTGIAQLDGTASRPELVLNSFDTSNILKAVDFTRNFMSNIKLPDFSSIIPKLSGIGGNTFSVNLGGITIQGTREGADSALKSITDGLKKIGVNLNQ